MAQHSVYSLREDFPRELRYRAATCRLELVRGEAEGEWIFRARKVVPATHCKITSTRFGLRALQAVLRSGFVVEDGTPAAKLLDRLVQDGFATKRHASRRDLD